MDVQMIEGHPRIEEVRNQVAIKRGPLVYCVETPDLPDGVKMLDVYLKGDTDFQVTYRPDFLGGVSTIDAQVMLRSDAGTSMYRPIRKPEWRPHDLQLVPYFAWSNRGMAEMSVFVPVLW